MKHAACTPIHVRRRVCLTRGHSSDITNCVVCQYSLRNSKCGHLCRRFSPPVIPPLPPLPHRDQVLLLIISLGGRGRNFIVRANSCAAPPSGRRYFAGRVPPAARLRL